MLSFLALVWLRLGQSAEAELCRAEAGDAGAVPRPGSAESEDGAHPRLKGCSPRAKRGPHPTGSSGWFFSPPAVSPGGLPKAAAADAHTLGNGYGECPGRGATGPGAAARCWGHAGKGGSAPRSATTLIWKLGAGAGWGLPPLCHSSALRVKAFPRRCFSCCWQFFA